MHNGTLLPSHVYVSKLTYTYTLKYTLMPTLRNTHTVTQVAHAYKHAACTYPNARTNALSTHNFNNAYYLERLQCQISDPLAKCTNVLEANDVIVARRCADGQLVADRLVDVLEAEPRDVKMRHTRLKVDVFRHL